MKKSTYISMTDRINSSRILKHAVVSLDVVLTKAVYIIYPFFIVALFVMGTPGLLRAVLVPGVSFVLLSLFRKIYNSPRPYEVFDFSPVIDKKTKGKSMPSRHVFSMFVIAVTVYCFYKVPGLVIGAAGIVMAGVRVVGGVHFPKDVIAGAVIGIMSGVIGFMI